jgi:hypothetical protein
MNLVSRTKDIYAEGRHVVWPAFVASLRRMLATVAVFLVLGGFALLTRFVAVWVRDLIAAAL